MSEVRRTTAKKSEAKRDNPVSQRQKAESSRSVNSPADRILFLQKTAGNQAVGRAIKSGDLQAKLGIDLRKNASGQESTPRTTSSATSKKTVPKNRLNQGIDLEAQHEDSPAAEALPETKKESTAPKAAAGKKSSILPSERKQKTELSDGGKEGKSVKVEIPEGASAAPEAVSISAEDPGQILEQLKNVPPTRAVDAHNQAQKASVGALEKQKQQVEQSLPEIPAPTGLPPKESRAEEKGKVAVTPEKAPSAFEGEKSGKEGEEYKPQVGEAPPPPSIKPTVLSGGEAEESSDTKLSQSAQNELEDIQLDTSQIGTNAGERPAVDITGEADPSQLDSFQSESVAKVQNAKAEASKEISRDFGENDIFPEPTDGTLKASKALSSPKIPSGKGGEALPIPSDAISGLNQSLGPKLKERIGEQKGEYDRGKEKFNSDSANARADADKQIANLNKETSQKQIEEQNKAKADVAKSRAEWQSELDSVEQNYQEKASKATEGHREKITKEKQKGEEKAAKHLDDAEKKAEQEKLKAEEKANEKKKEARKESKGFWGWVKSAASAFLDGLKKAVNFIYDGLRKAVKLIFEAAKALAKAAIELARMAIVGLIKGYGLILKGLVSVVFAAFPDIARKINSKIDKAVNVAVKAVNTAAKYLKKGVEAVLDFLASALDKLLGLIQSLYNGIFTVIGMIIRGEFKELMERIGSLVDAAKNMTSHLEGAIWEQLMGVDISKPMQGEAGYVPSEVASKESGEQKEAPEESGLTEDDIAVEPVAADSFEPELIEDLNLQDGEEKIIGERSGEAYSVAGILADFQQAEPGAGPAMEHAKEINPALTPMPTMSRAERAAKVWDQMKTFMGNWLKENWGKLLLAVIGALVGIIAATIITGGAILAALPIIMKIVAAIFIGVAIMKAMEYLKTYLSEGWEKKISPAAKALAGAVAVGIVEVAMALGFRVIGAGLKAAGRVVKAGAKLAVTGVKRAATATAAAIKSLLKSGAKLVSKSGSAIIRGGKLIFGGLKSGFSKGIKKAKDLASRLFAKFRFKKFKIIKRGQILQLFGFINPWILLVDGKIIEVPDAKIPKGARIGEEVITSLGRGKLLALGEKLPSSLKSIIQTNAKSGKRKLLDLFGIKLDKKPKLDVPSAPDGKSYITYTFKDAKGKVVYVGRASGKGTPEQVLMDRIAKGHEHIRPGYKPEVAAAFSSKPASQGAEEFFIQGFREDGAKLLNIEEALSVLKPERRGKSIMKLEAFFDEISDW